MRHEIILVKETESVKGTGFGIFLATKKDLVIPAKGTTILPLAFDFKPVTPTDNASLMVHLDWDAAQKGVVLSAWNYFPGESILSVILCNMSDKALTIPEDYDLVEVGLCSRIKIHAVKEDTGSLVNLNLTKN
jgi:hypothetical protein